MRAVGWLALALAGCGFSDEESGEPVEYTPPAGGGADGGGFGGCVDFDVTAASEGGDAGRVESSPAVAIDAQGRAAIAWIDAEGGGVESRVRVLDAERARHAPALPCDATGDVSLAYAADGALVLALRCADLEAGAEETSEIRVTRAPFDGSIVANEPGVAVDDPRLLAADRLLLAWSDGSVRVAASGDDGASFDASVSIAAGAHPALSAAGDAVLVAWDDGSQVYAARSDDDGATFGAAVPVGAGTLPALAGDGDDVWLARESGTAIVTARSTDGGASFAEIGAPAATTSTTRTPAAVAIDATGDAMVFWGEETGGLWSVTLATSVAGQAFVLAPIDGPLAAPCDQIGGPVALAPTGEAVVLAWTGGAGGQCEVLEGLPCD